jgi:prolyl-tRNA editing enzyme YbaK/EbsC (Cys-tRNA(Pro) deacylase)
VSRGAERFESASREAGLELEIRRFPEGTRTAADAARAVGCEIGQIVKSLVFMGGAEPFLALTSGPNRADLGRLAELVGVPVRRADAEEARAATGYAIGGTPPFGHLRPLRVFVDRDLLGYDVLWAAAGAPDAVFPITPETLLRLSGGRPGDFRER